jgi:hypothetical protein
MDQAEIVERLGAPQPSFDWGDGDRSTFTEVAGTTVSVTIGRPEKAPPTGVPRHWLASNATHVKIAQGRCTGTFGQFGT